MKITRILEDNGMKIMHVEYSKQEVAEVVAKAKLHKEKMEKERLEKQNNGKDKAEDAE